MHHLAQKYGVSLGVWAQDISRLHDTVQALEALGNRDLLLDVTGSTPKQTLANAVQARRGAILEAARSVGLPYWRAMVITIFLDIIHISFAEKFISFYSIIPNNLPFVKTFFHF